MYVLTVLPSRGGDSAAKLLTRDEARRIALGIVLLCFIASLFGSNREWRPWRAGFAMATAVLAVAALIAGWMGW